jgi:flagellar hook protein FlgE
LNDGAGASDERSSATRRVAIQPAITKTRKETTPMFDPYIMAVNNNRAARAWMEATSANLGNIYTPGYRQKNVRFADFIYGVQADEGSFRNDQGKSHPGKGPTNLMIEGNGWFSVRNKEGELRYTRTGDFKFNGEGVLVNEAGNTVQGFLLDESGKPLNTMDSTNGQVDVALNPNQARGGTGHIPTTEIVMWVDPTNGKFFGKYDEYKIRSDGTVVGVAKEGKETVPLYKIALSNFPNPSGLSQVGMLEFLPSEMSGEPIEGTGEIRSGLVELSNVSLKDQVDNLQQAKNLMSISTKMIQQNKALLEEALGLLR